MSSFLLYIWQSVQFTVLTSILAFGRPLFLAFIQNFISSSNERLIQTDIEDKMARKGVGLGLSITKVYVEMPGNKIWLGSELYINNESS